jgi:hypothetical protein
MNIAKQVLERGDINPLISSAHPAFEKGGVEANYSSAKQVSALLGE